MTSPADSSASDTPRTDKEVETLTDGFDFIAPSFACTLERELTEANEKLAAAETATIDRCAKEEGK